MTNNDCHQMLAGLPQHQSDSNCAQESCLSARASSTSNFDSSLTSLQYTSPQSTRRDLNYLMQSQAASLSSEAVPSSTKKRKRPAIQTLTPQLTLSSDMSMPVKIETTVVTPTYSSSRAKTTRMTLSFQREQKLASPMTSLIHQLVPNGMTRTVKGADHCSIDWNTAADSSIASFSDSDSDSESYVEVPAKPLRTSIATSESPPIVWQYYDSNRRAGERSKNTDTPAMTAVKVNEENTIDLSNRIHLLEKGRSPSRTTTPAPENETPSVQNGATTRPNLNQAANHTCNPIGGIKLNAKQAQAVQAIKDKKNVFLTGPAGTGKSMVLKQVLNYCARTYQPCQWVAVAPTGVTAIAIGGQTIHSFAGIGIPKEQADFNKAWQNERRFAWRELKIMIIDEISMIAGEFLDRLDSVVREIRDVDAPFGGIQVLICGDFLQLPPIVESLENMKWMRECSANPGKIHGNRGFAFQSYFWKEANMETIHLTEVFRQDNPQFVGVLSRIRTGVVWEQDRIFLAQCNRPLTLPSKDIEPTRLYSKNVDVNRENMMELARLDGDTHNYTAVDRVVPDPKAKCGAEEKLWNSDFFRQTVAENLLRLKIGAQVMLIKNDTLHPGTLVNGSRGVVVGFTKDKPGPPFSIPIGLPISDSNGVVNDDMYPIVKFQCGETRILGMTEFGSRIVGVGQCIRIAVPLKLAWAITVHKSQGMTLDYVKIDLAGVFCKAQAYVALSRAKDEKCLELRNFSPWLVKADTCALAFYDHPNIEIPNWDHREKWTRPRVKLQEVEKKVKNESTEQEKTEVKKQSWV